MFLIHGLYVLYFKLVNENNIYKKEKEILKIAFKKCVRINSVLQFFIHFPLFIGFEYISTCKGHDIV